MKKDRVKLVSTVEINAYSPVLMRNSPSESNRHSLPCPEELRQPGEWIETVPAPQLP